MNSFEMKKIAAIGALTVIGSAAIAGIQAMVPKMAEDAKPIPVGSMIPDSALVSLDGKATTAKKVSLGKPTVFVFYRGGWCPYCNVHLVALAKSHSDLKALGFQMVAVTPDSPEELKKTLGKEKLDYDLLSDSGAATMKAFGVAFEVDQKTVTMYKENYKIDIEKASGGQTHHILPVPSVFIADASGKIGYVHFNPDYRVRLTSEELMAAAKRIAAQ
jgi:peroxiredoxin